jgi:hypothetical protein
VTKDDYIRRYLTHALDSSGYVPVSHAHLETWRLRLIHGIVVVSVLCWMMSRSRENSACVLMRPKVVTFASLPLQREAHHVLQLWGVKSAIQPLSATGTARVCVRANIGTCPDVLLVGRQTAGGWQSSSIS